MAKYNYLQFANALPVETTEEKTWLENVLGFEFEFNYEDEDGYSKSKQKFKDQFGIDLLSQDDDYCMYPGPNYYFSEDSVIFESNEHSHGTRHGHQGEDVDTNLEFLGPIIQRFFQLFRPNGKFGLSYAETCAKMRVGEFGGGAMFVTANQVLYHNVADWLRGKFNE